MEMQSLWSKILGGEANEKGSFSKRTIELVSTFDKSDAQLFTNLCSFAWQLDDGLKLFIFHEIDGSSYLNEQDFYKNKNITFSSIHHLEAIGLVKYENITRY